MDEIVYNQSIDNINLLHRTLAQLDRRTIQAWGERAMEIISDYPLYVSGTDNITYEQAIIIAMTIAGDFMKGES